jgi:hypothetical protein
MKSRVAALRVKPDTVLTDIERLCGLAGMGDALEVGRTTILKDNISWHFPFPGANTTPWQLEGTVKALQSSGFDDLVCVQNQTVVTNAFKGEDLNRYRPVLDRYYMSWTPYSATASASPITSRARTSFTSRPSSATSTPRRPAP